MVVLDTCALIEACQISPRFSEQGLQQMKAGSYILSISFAEIACKIKIGKLEMGVSPKALFLELKQMQHIHIIDISVLEWLDSIELNWPDNKDPADRMIAAFAIQKKIPIMTTDMKISAFYQNVLW